MGDVKEVLNFIRVSLTTMKKAELKRLGDKSNDLFVNKGEYSLFRESISTFQPIVLRQVIS